MNRTKKMILSVFVFSLVILVSGIAGSADSQSVSMSFEACLAAKERTIASLGVNPRDIIPIVNTNVMTMTRVCTADGSVLITCSKPDSKMVITRSPHSESVGCRR